MLTYKVVLGEENQIGAYCIYMGTYTIVADNPKSAFEQAYKQVKDKMTNKRGFTKYANLVFEKVTPADKIKPNVTITAIDGSRIVVNQYFSLSVMLGNLGSFTAFDKPIPDLEGFCRSLFGVNVAYGYTLATCTNPKIRAAVALSDNAYGLETLVKDTDKRVRMAVARHTERLDLLQQLLEDTDEEVLGEVAKSGFGLEKLKNHPSPYIRFRVAMRGYALPELCNDPDEDVRRAAQYVSKMQKGQP